MKYSIIQTQMIIVIHVNDNLDSTVSYDSFGIDFCYFLVKNSER